MTMPGYARPYLNQTHRLLLAYAESAGSITVAGTIRQLTDWYRSVYSIRIPARTFQYHTRKLQDAGLISVRHTARRTFYTLLKDEIKVPKYRNVPVPGKPGVSDWIHDGFEVLRYTPSSADATAGADWFYRGVDPDGDYGVDHPEFNLDALEASWPKMSEQVTLFQSGQPDTPEGTVAAAGCWSCRIVRAVA